jgi:heme exporter protein C
MKIFLGFWLTVVIVVAFSFPTVANPQHWYEFPIVPGLEDKARILFFHVPMAWVTVVAFIVAMGYGIKYLVKKNPDDDIKSVSSASLGLMFCILATVTGSLWAKFNWGSFWNWDPRETSIFVLLLIYGAYFALRSALDADEKRATLSAVYSIIAGVTVPFFIFIMPRILQSLHPDPIINSRGKIDMNPTMLVVFLSSLAGFTSLYFWMWNLKVRLERLLYKQSMEEGE